MSKSLFEEGFGALPRIIDTGSAANGCCLSSHHWFADIRHHLNLRVCPVRWAVDPLDACSRPFDHGVFIPLISIYSDLMRVPVPGGEQQLLDAIQRRVKFPVLGARGFELGAGFRFSGWDLLLALSRSSASPRLARALKQADKHDLWGFFYDGVVIAAVRHPVRLVGEDRLHCPDGPAAAWAGGLELWFWQGVEVLRSIIKDPGSITLEAIEAQRNTEFQRVMIERFGWDRYAAEASHRVIDHHERWGTLVLNSRGLPYLIVVDRSPEPDGSFRRYVLPVDPFCRPLPDIESGETAFGSPQALTALNAVASTFGMTGEVYANLRAES